MANISKPQGAFARRFNNFFRQFHLLLFFILVSGLLAAGVMLLNNTLSETSDGTYTSSINPGSIDKATLERIQTLHTSSQPSTPPALPAGRSNPFAE